MTYPMRQYKCKYCKEFIPCEELFQVPQRDRKGNIKHTKTGKISYYRYHKKCYEFLKEEKQGWDNLFQYVLDTYFIKTVPSPIIIRLQDLRNGSSRLGKQIQYKQGYKYQTILGCFKSHEDYIKNAIRDKDFKTDVQKGNYIMAIIEGQINQFYLEEEKQRVNKKINTQKLQMDIKNSQEPIKKVKIPKNNPYMINDQIF